MILRIEPARSAAREGDHWYLVAGRFPHRLVVAHDLAKFIAAEVFSLVFEHVISYFVNITFTGKAFLQRKLVVIAQHLQKNS